MADKSQPWTRRLWDDRRSNAPKWYLPPPVSLYPGPPAAQPLRPSLLENVIPLAEEVDRIVALDAHLLRWEVDIYNPHIRIPFAFQLSKVAKPGSRLVGLVLKGCYCIFVP